MTIEDLDREAADSGDASSSRSREPAAHIRLGGFLALAVLILVVALIAAGVLRLISVSGDETASAPPPPIDGASSAPQSTAARLADVSFVDARTGQKSPIPRSIRSVYPVGTIQVSPDGTKLALNGPHKIYVANVDGTNVRALADGDIESAPSWSPDGKSVVFNVAGKLLIADVSTGKTTRILNSRRSVYHPNFSSDGEQILFSRSPGGPLALWTVPVSGGQATLLHRHSAFGTYSPDGTSIVFRRTIFDGKDVMMMTESAVRIANADGSTQRRLTELGASMNRVGKTLLPQIDSRALWPMWSPDGTRIVYERLYDRGVYVHNVRTGRTWSISDGTRPSWLDNNTLIVADH